MKTYLKFACIYCGQHMECDPGFVGRQILCPVCLHKIVIPIAHGGGPARQALLAPQTWDTRVPMPKLEVPTRYRMPAVSNRFLAQPAQSAIRPAAIP